VIRHDSDHATPLGGAIALRHEQSRDVGERLC